MKTINDRLSNAIGWESSIGFITIMENLLCRHYKCLVFYGMFTVRCDVNEKFYFISGNHERLHFTMSSMPIIDNVINAVVDNIMGCDFGFPIDLSNQSAGACKSQKRMR